MVHTGKSPGYERGTEDTQDNLSTMTLLPICSCVSLFRVWSNFSETVWRSVRQMHIPSQRVRPRDYATNRARPKSLPIHSQTQPPIAHRSDRRASRRAPRGARRGFLDSGFWRAAARCVAVDVVESGFRGAGAAGHRADWILDSGLRAPPLAETK